uniref:Fimbrial assembly family protein n=1 Tax=Candidatus Giovannonibacteria bacterium GW2011_GWF2_42_19 TaxID=1618659 RepID=A0A0G1BHK1_9BACT|nr:MAG: hypothetical protein UV11_C0040G0004 [Candidatus Giovannonibacteria bacterium GW2011_GWF2_42_19]
MQDSPFSLSKKYSVNSYPVKASVSSMGAVMFLGIIVLIISILMFGGVFLWKKLTEGQINELNASIKRAEADFDPPFIKEVSRTAKAIDDVTKLLSGHRATSKVFKFLEDNTLVEVSFSNFNFNAANNVVTLSGEALGYSALALQFSKIEQNPMVKAATLSNIAVLDKGTIGFNLTLNLDSEVIKYK